MDEAHSFPAPQGGSSGVTNSSTHLLTLLLPPPSQPRLPETAMIPLWCSAELALRRVAWKQPMFFDIDEVRLSRLPPPPDASLESEEESSIQSVVADEEDEEEEEVRPPPLLEWIGDDDRRRKWARGGQARVKVSPLIADRDEMRGKFEGLSCSLPLVRLTKDSRPGSGLESLITSWSGFPASSFTLGQRPLSVGRVLTPLTSTDWEWEWQEA